MPPKTKTMGKGKKRKRLLAFEAIPLLRKKFIEDIAGADEGCPRMCKVKFKKNHLKGIPLDTINHELGTTQVIDCIVTPRIEEHILMKAITEEKDDADMADVVVESWLQRSKEGCLIRFEELYQQDLQARRIIAGPEIAGDEDIPAVDGQEPPSLVAVVKMIENMKDQEEKNKEKNGDPKETNQEKDGDPKEANQEKDGDPKEKNQEKDGDPKVPSDGGPSKAVDAKVTKRNTRGKKQLG
ncbi:hypothetical protein ISN45_Aa08g009600 [Arabidopsis thaliana x Arabidopsis arenosa]|uniref:DUF287 domain-containing protein n=1 Tax=Arabidopsis thaliana x Arabidopsis arenosa TaxID=1240361 RepID=A0A8T1XNH8_9BRAS|nr:hypothetical protein ISN45_Aa08g009600 [Arabidopsis thaliana x Arabidopsis arenosa]